MTELAGEVQMSPHPCDIECVIRMRTLARRVCPGEAGGRCPASYSAGLEHRYLSPGLGRLVGHGTPYDPGPNHYDAHILLLLDSVRPS